MPATSRYVRVLALIGLGKPDHFLLLSFVALLIQRHQAPSAFRTDYSPQERYKFSGSVATATQLPTTQQQPSQGAEEAKKLAILLRFLVCLIVMLTFSQEALLVKNSNGVGSQQAGLKERPQHAEAVHDITHTLLPPVLCPVLILSLLQPEISPQKSNEGFLQDLVSVTNISLCGDAVFFFLLFPSWLFVAAMFFFCRLQRRANWKRRRAQPSTRLPCALGAIVLAAL